MEFWVKMIIGAVIVGLFALFFWLLPDVQKEAGCPECESRYIDYDHKKKAVVLPVV